MIMATVNEQTYQSTVIWLRIMNELVAHMQTLSITVAGEVLPMIVKGSVNPRQLTVYYIQARTNCRLVGEKTEPGEVLWYLKWHLLITHRHRLSKIWLNSPRRIISLHPYWMIHRFSGLFLDVPLTLALCNIHVSMTPCLLVKWVSKFSINFSCIKLNVSDRKVHRIGNFVCSVLFLKQNKGSDQNSFFPTLDLISYHLLTRKGEIQ